MLDALNIDTPYLSVKREYTLAGTRPGARWLEPLQCSTTWAFRA